MVVLGKLKDNPRLSLKLSQSNDAAPAVPLPEKELEAKVELSADEKFVKKLNRLQQIDLLKELGVKRSPSLEKDRVSLLLQLFKEKPKDSANAIKQLHLV